MDDRLPVESLTGIAWNTQSLAHSRPETLSRSLKARSCNSSSTRARSALIRDFVFRSIALHSSWLRSGKIKFYVFEEEPPGCSDLFAQNPLYLFLILVQCRLFSLF